MKRFKTPEDGRKDMPGDAANDIVVDGEQAIIRLERALILDRLTVALVDEMAVDEEDSKAYAVSLGGKMAIDGERRDFMVVLGSRAVASLIAELSLVAARAGDDVFIEAFKAERDAQQI
jgi:hypothetical protein